jgi:prepilin-type N-terminal cleavage/methylation domain-containing protein
MRLTSPNRRSGFTMIEMLVVFVVFAAAVMIAIRSVGETLRRDKLAKTAAMVSSDLEQSFALAARQRAPVRLLISSTNRTISVASRADTTFKYRTRDFRSGEFTLDYLTTNDSLLDVMPTGLSTDTLNLVLGVYSGGKSYSKTLRMTRAGLVRVGKQ